MIISLNDITSHFSILNPENLQMFVKWILLSPSQKYPQKSEQMSAPSGIQLGAGQFAYLTLKTGTDKHVFSAYIFADSATSFRQTNFYRITLTHYLMFGKNCKNKISDVFQAYRKADETVSLEESMPRQQRLEMLAKRSGGSYDKFLGLAKAHELINGFDRNQVAEIKRFWDARNTLSEAQQQAPQAAPPAQSPFSGQQQPVQIASGPLQSPFATQQTPQVAPPAQSPFAEQQSIQAPTTPSMAPQAYQTQVSQATLEGIYSLLQQLLAANTAQASVTAP